MRSFYGLTELGKLRAYEVIMFILTFIIIGVVPFFLTLVNSIFLLFVFTVLMVVTLYLISLYRRGKGTKDYPKNYSKSLYLLFFSLITIFVLALINSPILLSYGLVLVLFAYMLIGGIILYYLINVLYIYGLKKMFPHEGEVNMRQEDELSQKKLSKYMDLDNQKIYFSITLINFFIYLSLVFFCMLLYIKYIDGEHLKIIEAFSSWVKNKDSITFFNGISLLSLMIAIFTLTFSAQNKIIKEAKNRYRDKYKEYF